AQVEVERGHAPLDVHVIEDEMLAGFVHGERSLRQELLEQLRGEQRLREAQPAELLCIDEPSRAVVAEVEAVFRQHVLPQHALGIGETVADHLEDDVEGGQREAHHDQAPFTRRVHEAIGGSGKMAHDLAVTLRLALPGAPQHREELAHRLARHQGLEEHHRFRDVLEICMEVRAREAEYDADIALREHYRIDEHAAVGVLERYDQRHQEVASDQPSDDVGPGDLIEDRSDHLDALYRALLAAAR